MTRSGQEGRVIALAGRFASLSLLAAALSVRAPAQEVRCDPGDLEVMRLEFTGNAAFAADTLANGIVTTPSSWARRRFGRLGFGTARCLDRREFPLDVVRLLIWYRRHGYPEVAVDTAVTPVGARRIAVRFTIREGAPMIVDALAVTGLDGVPERDAITRRLPAATGRPFDRDANEATRDTLLTRLRNGGYPDAEVFVGYDTHRPERRAEITFTVAPGPRLRLGEVRARITPRAGAAQAIDSSTARRIADLTPGQLYSEEALQRAKRALYQTEAFTEVSVRADSAPAPGDSAVGITLDVTEGLMRSLRAGGGWGTLDCVRASGEFTRYDFFGGAARLDLRGRVSKIGVGEPVTGLESVCPQAKSDLYSKDLNYYAGASVTQPAIFHEFIPSFSLYSERRSEYNAYLRTTPVGGSLALTRLLSRLSQSVSYTVEFGRTEAQPALLCAVFNACEDADRAAFRRSQLLAVASFAVAREATDDPLNPTRGTVGRAEFRTAGSYTGSDRSLRFNKMLVDGSAYAPAGGAVVLAARVRFGVVVGPSLSFNNAALFVPQQERLFAGGPTTVRGFRQNELGPAAYIPTAYDTVRADGTTGGNPSNAADTVYFRANADSVTQRTVPTGGNTLVVAMLEARIRSPIGGSLLEFTAFTDAGAVWNRGAPGAALGFGALRWTPGLGARLRTFFGVLRVDVAYNPYARPSGAAYFDTPVFAGGALFCVSPGNTLRVTAAPGGQVQQASGECPASFQPPRERSFLRRLTPSISIGQAF